MFIVFLRVFCELFVCLVDFRERSWWHFCPSNSSIMRSSFEILSMKYIDISHSSRAHVKDGIMGAC
jgi:hypothetical protein